MGYRELGIRAFRSLCSRFGSRIDPLLTGSAPDQAPGEIGFVTGQIEKRPVELSRLRTIQQYS